MIKCVVKTFLNAVRSGSDSRRNETTTSAIHPIPQKALPAIAIGNAFLRENCVSFFRRRHGLLPSKWINQNPPLYTPEQVAAVEQAMEVERVKRTLLFLRRRYGHAFVHLFLEVARQMGARQRLGAIASTLGQRGLHNPPGYDPLTRHYISPSEENEFISFIVNQALENKRARANNHGPRPSGFRSLSGPAQGAFAESLGWLFCIMPVGYFLWSTHLGAEACAAVIDAAQRFFSVGNATELVHVASNVAASSDSESILAVRPITLPEEN